MSGRVRHAVYWVPAGALGRWGAGWLGWDVEAGRAVDHPEVDGLPRPLPEITEEPRRYGLHATLKPPFRLAEGRSEAGLEAAVAALAATLAPVRGPGLALTRIGGFLALVPEEGPGDGPQDAPLGTGAALARLAAATVAALDGFRAPPGKAELVRRRAAGLTPAQEENLRRWGYPYVMGEFRFHVTLTGPLGPSEAGAVEVALGGALRGPLGGPPLRPFALDALAHVAEREDGRFRLIGRHPLHGSAAS